MRSSINSSGNLPRRHTMPLERVEEVISQLTAPRAVKLSTETLPLAEAAGRIAAVDQCSPTDLPPFDRSAVDGYGLTKEDIEHPRTLSILGRFAAGTDSGDVTLPSGKTIWLATGAAVPPLVAGIVMEECVRVDPFGEASFPAQDIQAASNIRRRGEDVARGSVIVTAGMQLDSRHIGMLAAAGVAAVTVRRKLRILLLSTGSELKVSDKCACASKVFDSNRPMLRALLSSPSTDIQDGGVLGDDPETLANALAHAALRFDLIVTTGSAAGSETDFLADAVAIAGGRVSRHHVAIKPGKPLLTGTIGYAAFLGLPGNPVSAYVTALLFAVPVIETLTSGKAKEQQNETAVAGETISHRRGRVEYAPAEIIGSDQFGRKVVRKLGSGGSASLSPLLKADGLVQLRSDDGDVPAGQAVLFRAFSSY